MENSKVIENTIAFVKKELNKAEGGHDWFHVKRVWNLAKYISQHENVNVFVVELGALLHDIADSKFHGGDETIGPAVARDFLKEQKLEEAIIAQVVKIVASVSFRGGNEAQEIASPELQVVQDADRLDAMGAIGIARAFNYGGHKGRLLYDPLVKPNYNLSKEEYKASTAPTINHFYEKLLRLKNGMNTETGRKLAQKRHEFMEQYLAQFYVEWDGKA